MITIGKPASHEEEIKKSRFIANALRVKSPEEALERAGEISLPDATHNCWAYKIGDKYRFSDDGEPGGSAGRPILAAIEGQGLDQVLVVVTRYFGGRKLGVGGLVRAYGGTAAECLRLAIRLEVKPRSGVKIEVPFPEISNVYRLLHDFNISKVGETYIESGVILELELESEVLKEFELRLSDITRGAYRIVEIRELE